MRQSAEETLLAYQLAMGQELGTAYNRLLAHVIGLKEKWGDFLALYGTNSERVELLNLASPGFFGRIQDVLWLDAIQHVCRLTDPPKTGNKKNLTFRQLQQLMQSTIAASIDGQLADVEAKTKFCRDWRNRVVSHLDYEHAMDPHGKPLDSANRRSMKEAIKAMDEFLCAIHRCYTGNDLRFLDDDDGHCAVQLLHVLDDGLRADKERHERRLSGTYRPDDIGPPKRPWM
jgi:hypothetical protein